MAKDTKRFRASNWSHEETMDLAVLKKKFSTETGPVMWQKISSLFPDQRRSADQCKRRWDNVVKVRKKIESYRRETGREHWQLNDEELTSLGLETEYGRDWYNVVEEVYGKSPSGGLAAGTMSNGSNTGSHSDSLPEHTPAMAPQASTSESDEQVEPGIVLLPWLEGECSSPLQQCGPDINTAVDSNLKDNFDVFEPPPWDTNDSNTRDTYLSQGVSNLKISTVSKSTSIVLDGTSSGQASGRNEIIEELEAHSDLQSVSEEAQQSQPCALPDEQVETGIGPRRLERECPSHQQQHGAVNVAGAMGSNLEENFSVFATPPWDTNDSNTMGTYLSQDKSNLKTSTVSKSSSIVLDGTISGQASGRNEIIQGLEAHSDLQSVSEKDQQSQPCALPVIELKVTLCCESCIRKLSRKLEALNGVEKVIYDRHNMKVSVTTTAAPEDVLKQVQLVKKTAAMWPQQ